MNIVGTLKSRDGRGKSGTSKSVYAPFMSYRYPRTSTEIAFTCYRRGLLGSVLFVVCVGSEVTGAVAADLQAS